MQGPSSSEQITRASINLISALVILAVVVIAGLALYWFATSNGLL